VRCREGVLFSSDASKLSVVEGCWLPCSLGWKIVKEKGEREKILKKLTCGTAAGLVSGCAGQGRWGGMLRLDILESCDG
jgi:hypothetical protein